MVVWQLQSYHISIHTKTWFISGVFVLFTLLVSRWDILKHVVHLSRPALLKSTIRTLWMVPVFNLVS